jgi:hypothetical protein
MAVGVLGLVSIGASLIGGGISAIGAMQQANAQAAAAEYQAAVARNMAKYTIEQGQVEEQQQRMKTNAILAQTRAVIGASGVDVNTGTPSQVQVSGQTLGELDALTVRNNAYAKAVAYQDQAKLYDMQASSDQTAGWLSALGSVMGSAASVSDKWMSFQQQGMFA